MKKRYKWLLAIICIISFGYLLPQDMCMPVEAATKRSYNQNSFWAFPWGKSITHKGVDIFAKEGTNVNSSTDGITLFAGKIDIGGNVVLLLGAKWRIHYYAHLKQINTRSFSMIKRNEKIGTVGTTGNAKGKPPHLHYSIFTIFPYVWRIDNDRQGWKKMFYLNPIIYLNK